MKESFIEINLVVYYIYYDYNIVNKMKTPIYWKGFIDI